MNDAEKLAILKKRSRISNAEVRKPSSAANG